MALKSQDTCRSRSLARPKLPIMMVRMRRDLSYPRFGSACQAESRSPAWWIPVKTNRPAVKLNLHRLLLKPDFPHTSRLFRH